jgi:hypothetical protein
VGAKHFDMVSHQKVAAIPKKPEIPEREKIDMKTKTSEATKLETEIECDAGSNIFIHMMAGSSSNNNSKGLSIASSTDTTDDLFNRAHLLFEAKHILSKHDVPLHQEEIGCVLWYPFC